jgi:archaetidylinositol phosphate synthase
MNVAATWSFRSFHTAQRIHGSLLASVEKRFLIWLAGRMPRWIHSDHLSLLGLVSMVAAGVCYSFSGTHPVWLWAVNLCIALNWAGDSLDGTVARVRNRQRPRYGFYVDHVIDVVSAVFLIGGLGLSGYMSPWVASALLVAFLLLSVESYLATYTLGQFHVSHGLFGPTELRLLLMAGNWVLLGRTEAILFGKHFPLFDVGGVIGAAGMLAVFVWTAVRHTVELYREERLP